MEQTEREQVQRFLDEQKRLIEAVGTKRWLEIAAQTTGIYQPVRRRYE